MTNYTHTPYHRNIVTAENIKDAREMLPLDQGTELETGCETWGILYTGGQRGQMTRWPNGRGAVCFGGDSEWGDWDGEILTTDDGTRYNEDGEETEE
ncbi:hypothetical protein Dcar01_03516 [Deinococcus carri]|uniref:Uncharacterized protein n=1 Tax=Deinococcus carri TaxID=1211323 RepID=A0ABP9WBQ2_9DEIO